MSSPSKGERILLVEDEESLRLLYEEELRAEGYEVFSAPNGKEALRQLEAVRPDLIILDIVMPVMDGMEALGRILRRERSIPIILHTSYPGYREDFMSWAADAYVAKSPDLRELKRTIQELLKKGRKA
jgi:CheY-like chemotaxis protein